MEQLPSNKDILDAINKIEDRLDKLEDHFSNFIKFYIMTWANLQEEQTEMQKVQEELRESVGL